MNAITTTIHGNATGDPSMFRFDDGGLRASVTIAVNDTYYDVQAGEWKDRKPEFVRVQVRRRSLAMNVVESVRKGLPLIASGRLVTHTWVDQNGGTRTELLLHADSVGIELTHGTATYVKAARNAVDENTGEIYDAESVPEPKTAHSEDGESTDVAQDAASGESTAYEVDTAEEREREYAFA